MFYQQIFGIALVLGFSECAFVDTLKKCHLNDEDCLTNIIQIFIGDNAGPGVPELNISSIDPAILKNVKVSILNIFDLTLIDGSARGIKKCKVNNFNVNIEKKRAHADVICDLIVSGTYKLHSDSEQIKTLLGGVVVGNGNGKITIEKLNIKFVFPLEVIKRDDDIFLVSELKSVEYTFDVLGKLEFEADKLYVGGKESSKEIVKLINENWKIIGNSFGKPVLDVALEIVYDFLRKFVYNVPAKYYILDDLTQYLK